jgi:phosphoglycolate phosphatase-like HAD superfamily hydrolase
LNSFDRKPLLVFDFDGVISESVHDSFRTALNTYIDLFPGHRLPILKGVNPPELIFEIETKYPLLYKMFRQTMPFGNRAEDYYVILNIIENQKSKSIHDQQAYDRYKSELPPERLKRYHQYFYRLRRSYQADPEKWVRLLPPFPGVVEAIKRLSERYILAIATSKDELSIHIQLRSYGLNGYFRDRLILDKEISSHKRDHLIHLHHQSGLPFEQIRFIDDKVLHLIDVADLGVRCFLATWGFNTPREHRIAESNGFRLLKLADLPGIE